MNDKISLGKALTWNEIANIYDSCHFRNKSEMAVGRPARTLPMEQVFDWVAKQKDKFVVTKDGTLHQIESDK